MPKTVAVVGAGPKAAALAARRWVMNDLADDPAEIPQLLIFERDSVGAAWSGDGQFSSGFLELCTPPEKDVGFPYVESFRRPGYREAIAPALFGKFSWQSFCVVQ